ncbi:hypothetical protein L228DRAFT_237804 [Xylona heveae TC161]|uniref:Uncharacterized protein n=1 Tax=Xylona heveae (strain CBS 132557 / TC161) TaxID=1328760 RepID=A0A165HAM4_XYLHT|nr:hypothetical protein L228DRAFT_237804 [Xylona heveae TC161]KZF23219.1 hypothetical protein L228DRAFT_237804 [Xylona heveae TC161]
MVRSDDRNRSTAVHSFSRAIPDRGLYKEKGPDQPNLWAESHRFLGGKTRTDLISPSTKYSGTGTETSAKDWHWFILVLDHFSDDFYLKRSVSRQPPPKFNANANAKPKGSPRRVQVRRRLSTCLYSPNSPRHQKTPALPCVAWAPTRGPTDVRTRAARPGRPLSLACPLELGRTILVPSTIVGTTIVLWHLFTLPKTAGKKKQRKGGPRPKWRQAATCLPPTGCQRAVTGPIES